MLTAIIFISITIEKQHHNVYVDPQKCFYSPNQLLNFWECTLRK